MIAEILPFVFKCPVCGAKYSAYSKRDGRKKARECADQGIPSFIYKVGFSFSTHFYGDQDLQIQVTGHVIEPETHRPLYVLVNKESGVEFPAPLEEYEVAELINS